MAMYMRLGFLGSSTIVCRPMPPSSERWMTWPNQLLVCEAYSRFGSVGEPFMWYTSHPLKSGSLTFHFWRFPSPVMTKPPFFVPTRTRMDVISEFLYVFVANGGIISPPVYSRLADGEIDGHQKDFLRAVRPGDARIHRLGDTTPPHDQSRRFP